MAEDKNTSQVNMKIPGMKGGPRNRGAAVEKPVNGKETFMRLMQYFANTCDYRSFHRCSCNGCMLCLCSKASESGN